MFELNSILFPNSANVWDSLGEFEMKQGNINLAIKYYEKVLEIDSNNVNAKNKLERVLNEQLSNNQLISMFFSQKVATN